MQTSQGLFRAVISILYVSVLVVGYFGWLYYREWKMKRLFNRHWGNKMPKAAVPRLSAIRADAQNPRRRG